MSNRRSASFRLAVEAVGPRPLVPIDHYQFPYNPDIKPEATHSLFSMMVRKIAREFLTDELDRQYYVDNYRGCPPPLFVPVITLVGVRND